MPNITEYTTPLALVPQPDDRAVSTAREAGTVKNIFARETGQAIGTAISHVGGQVGEAIDRHLAMQWIGHGAAAYSSLYGEMTQQWNDVAAKSDPNDTSIAQGFKEKVLAPSLDKFQQAFEGAPARAQEWALSRSDEMRQHFFQKMSADMGTRAGLAVHQNVLNLERNYSITAMNDPTSLPHIVDSIKTDIGTLVSSTPNLSSSDAARVQTELVPKITKAVAQSAFDGMAQRNPQAALLALDHGDFNDYADGVTQAQWRRYAETQQKVQDQDQKREELDAKRKRIEDSADKAEGYRTKMYDANTGRILPVQAKLNQQIVQDMNSGALTRADGTALIRWNQQQYETQLREDKLAALGPPAKDDQQVLAELRERVGSTTNPTTRQEIVDAQAADKLTVKSAHDLAWRVGQADAAWQATQRPFQAQFNNFKHVMLNSLTSLVKYMEPQQQIQKFNEVEADAQRILRDAYTRREDMRPYLDPASPKWALKEALSSLSTKPSMAVQQQADQIRNAPQTNAKGWKLMTDKAGNLAYVSPDKKEFEPFVATKSLADQIPK